jgi:hypothetical protein
MDRPGWIEPTTWKRLVLVLEAQPAHADDALGDLEAVTATWSAEARTRLLERVTHRAAGGAPLPAALMLALGEVLDE